MEQERQIEKDREREREKERQREIKTDKDRQRKGKTALTHSQILLHAECTGQHLPIALLGLSDVESDLIKQGPVM